MHVKQLSALIKIVLCIVFLISLLRLPYGYYQFVRFAGMAGFILLAYFAFQERSGLGVIIFIFLAILFQPIIKIALGRTIWNIVDVVVAIGLIVSLRYSKKF